jgi:hypothetical protein
MESKGEGEILPIAGTTSLERKKCFLGGEFLI